MSDAAAYSMNGARDAAAGATHRAPPATSRIGSYWSLYLLTLRQHMHGKRWMALVLLFLLPAGMAVLIRSTIPHFPSRSLEFVLSWMLVPQALLPLIALLYASGIIQDEQEDQTITYLLIRPLPKWMIYLVKMLATWTTTVVLTIVLTVLTYIAIYARSDVGFAEEFSRCLRAAEIHSLAVIAYSSIFGLLGLITKRALIVGMMYMVVVEGLLANLPLSLRMGTVIYYSRMIAYRTLDFVTEFPGGRKVDVAAEVWFLDTGKLTEHPQVSSCILFLAITSVVCTAIAAILCSQREFHVKTPEKD